MSSRFGGNLPCEAEVSFCATSPSFDDLRADITATLERRNPPAPEAPPLGLFSAFAADPA